MKYLGFSLITFIIFFYQFMFTP